jgi:putative DNA primase/helicase
MSLERRGSTREAFELGSDVEVAKRMLDEQEHRGGGPLVYTRGDLYQYRAQLGIWRVVPRFELERIVHEFDGSPIGHGGVLKVRQATVAGAIQRAHTIAADPEFFDKSVEGIAFSDCFVVVARGGPIEHPHAADHRATVAMPIAFGSGAKCDRFLRMLDEIFAGDADKPAKITSIRQFVGACLIGVATRYQIALVLFGVGANGKSVLLSIIEALFPSGAVASIPPQDLGQEYRRAMLAGVRLNMVNEIPERDVLDSEALKAVISGDLIVGRKIRDAPFAFRPTAGHIYSGNRLPGTTDQSHGFWRRLVPIEFGRVFAPHEQDPELAATIIRDELPGVARWAIEGAVEVQRAGRLMIPASADRARVRWQEQADQVRLFVSARLRASLECEIGGERLYSVYSAWAKANGHRPLASNKFAERLEEAGIGGRRTRHGKRWHVELVPDDTSRGDQP